MPNLRQHHETSEITIAVPLFVTLPRKRTVDKRFWLNLNVYRNAHYQILDAAKKSFAEMVLGAVADAGLRLGTRLDTPVEMIYTLYPKINYRVDIGNVLSVVQKFTEDALVSLRFLPEDNHTVIQRVTHIYGRVDKLNPRAEVVIRTLPKAAPLGEGAPEEESPPAKGRGNHRRRARGEEPG